MAIKVIKAKPSPYPTPGSQQDRLLRGLLAGDKISPISALVDYNVFIPAARCAELRGLGWPVRKSQIPHPNQEKFYRATLPVYFIDDHFRLWYATQPDDAHPAEYKGKEGRGKFADHTLDDLSLRVDDGAERKDIYNHAHRDSALRATKRKSW